MALMAFLAIGCLNVYAVDDLQEYLDRLAAKKTRAGDTPTVIDLSNFTGVVRTKTLVVENLNLRFINGTLSRAETLDGPMIRISKGSKVDLGDGAVFSGSGLYLGHEVVRVEDASFIVSTGSVTDMKTSSKVPTTRHIASPNIDIAVGLYSEKSEHNKESSFKITGGRIDGTLSCGVSTAYIHLDGGKIGKVITSSSTEVFGSVEVSTISCGKTLSIWDTNAKIEKVSLSSGDNSYVLLCNHLRNDITIDKGYMSRDVGNLHSTAPTYWRVPNGGVVVKGAEKAYELTSEDLSHIKHKEEGYVDYADGTTKFAKYEYVIKGHEIVIQPKQNEISTPDDLQAKLDEIAASGQYSYSNPCVIELADAIKLDKKIIVPTKCYAVITGGKLIIVGNQITAPDAFCVYGSLTLRDIGFDCCNNRHIQLSRYFYVKGGSLTIGENVEFTNIHEDSSIGLCYLAKGNITYKSGVFISKGTVIDGSGYDSSVHINGGTIESAGTAINEMAGVYFHGSGTVIGGDLVIDCYNFSISDGSTIKSTSSNAILVKLKSTDGISGGDFIGDNAKIHVRELMFGKWEVKHPIIYLDAKAQYCCFDILSEIQKLLDELKEPSLSDDRRKKILIFIYYHYQKKITGEWANYPMNTDIVTNIPSSDVFKYLFDFGNMPSGLEMFYNEKTRSAKLRKLN